MSEERLDDTTELCMGALREATLDFQRDLGRGVSIRDVIHAENVLRKRIRTLVEESRKQGADEMWTECDTRGIPHV